MLFRGCVLWLALVLICGQVSFGETVVFNLNPATGDPVGVQVTTTDIAGGFVTVQVDVINAPPTGDLLGVYFNLQDLNFQPDTAWLNSITGDDITARALDTNDVAPFANVNPLAPFDVGVGIGTPGIGTDDIDSTTITIPDITTGNLESFAVRINSVTVGDSRSGSSKLFGDRIPEPATASIIALGAAFFLTRRR